MRHLLLNLEAPLMAFGGETIDNYGVIRDFPAASMLTGLLANALGWQRIERKRHQQLQDRLVFAARIDREPAGGVRLTDFQTAQLEKKDRGWTTRGLPEGRAGGANTYDAPHLRYRDYFADMRVTVALRLEPAADAPTLDDLARVLDEPQRPLFIGRKPCVPSGRLFRCFSNEGATALGALMDIPLDEPTRTPDELVRLIWPADEGVDEVMANRTYQLTDERNWITGLHGGGRQVCEGSRPIVVFPSGDEVLKEAQS